MMTRIFLFYFFGIISTYAQITGCTDPLSKNHNPNATLNDGSCLYENFKIKPKYSIRLSDSIKETSGLIAFDNLLWTHNDDHDTTLYGLDTLGKIQKKIVLENVKNNDWEEISQDSNHLYIGDFGNNATGNRTDLHILKIEKKSFLEGNPLIDTISFFYSNQSDFNSKHNTNNFDCEAFIVAQDSIYLFTKQWKTSQTAIYSLPKESGNHIAKFKEILKTKGLVTGAFYFEPKRNIVLCGYSKKGKPFLYLLYDFKDQDFLSGNKRRINLPFNFLQVEGITTNDGTNYYLTNEALVRKPVLNVPPQIHHFDLSPILNSYLYK